MIDAALDRGTAIAIATVMPIIHLAARSRPGLAPFESAEAAAWTWQHMRESFPMALGAVIMPNHLQFMVDVDAIDRARSKLARILGHLQRWLGPCTEMWERVRAPKIVAPGGPVRRDLRYLDLNAPRARLVCDPLEWPWSTLRDVMGAVADPWIDADRLARALGYPVAGFRARWHAYVSSDPSVAVGGTPVPRAAPPTLIPTRPLEEILRAAAAALRLPVDAARSSTDGRRLFVSLARQQGWTTTAILSSTLGVTVRSVNRLQPADANALAAAALCLGDHRLLAPFDAGWSLGCVRSRSVVEPARPLR